MRTAAFGIRELKNRLSAAIDRVRTGEAVTVTDRRVPVAVLVPFASPRADAAIRALVEAGRILWAGGKPRGSPRPARVRGASVSKAVVEDRR